MPFDLQTLINSAFGLNLAILLGRSLPPRLGHPFAYFIADRIFKRKKSGLVRALRLNQWVISDMTLDKNELDQAARATLRNSARFLYDLYHFVRHDQASKRLIIVDTIYEKLLQRPEFDTRGLMIVGLHQGNFDLVLQCFVKLGLKSLLLTIPDPKGGGRQEFEMRKAIGMNLLPASVGAYKQALKHLQRGGMVITGMDRPIPQPEAQPCFFGQPAALPVHHTFLALKAQVPVLVVVNHLLPDGRYHVLSSDFIEMDHYPDREIEALRNAEKVLNIAEGFVRQAPQQWTESLPVWPALQDRVPE